MTTRADAIKAAKQGYAEAGLNLRSYEEREDCLVIDGYAKIDLRGTADEIRVRARSLAWQLQNTFGT